MDLRDHANHLIDNARQEHGRLLLECAEIAEARQRREANSQVASAAVVGSAVLVEARDEQDAPAAAAAQESSSSSFGSDEESAEVAVDATALFMALRRLVEVRRGI